MKPETLTPRTDAQPWINRYPEYQEGSIRWVSAAFARELERELAELRKNTSELIVSLQEEMDGVERELAAKDAHADEIYKASVGLANMLERKLERERELADRLGNAFLYEWGPSADEAIAAWKEARSEQ